MLTSFADESLRRRPADHSVYAMGAVVLESAHHDTVRVTLESLRLGKKPRLHWRDESSAHRLVIAQQLAGLPISGVVVVLFYDGATRTERARRRCFERLLVELEQAGVETVVVESRSPTMDLQDRRLLTALRRSRTIHKDTHVSWQQSFDEPILWAADAVASATTWWLDGDRRYFDLLADQVRVECLH
ncbi:hypothetical protein J5X84_29285 [Streptosporangiaceae bacterium NEAU-GS5]|nr:hypothetical protein [Streptosporangiaceae bacterium NEAU-GS5]